MTPSSVKTNSNAKTYLVTGAAGFIGARFVESCIAKKINVVSVDAPEHFRNRTEHRGVQFGEIIDREQLFEFLKSSSPQFDAIIHLGACSNTMQMDEAYLRRMNVEYSQKLWTYATEKHVPFVYASSAATYGDGNLGYDDNESLISQLRALNPYGESKRIFDLWALEQEKKGLHPQAWSGFKFFNVYGFGERHKNKMASVVLHSFDQIQKNGFVQLFRSHRAGIADGHQKRDFIFVDDVVNALHFAATKPISRGIYNLGTGQARTFLDLTQAVFKAINKKEDIRFIDTPESLRDRYQYFTEAKMEKLKSAGFTKTFTSLEDGVQQYIRRLQQAR